MPDSLVNRPFVRFLVLACASALSVGTVAAQRAQLTPADYDRAVKMLGQNVNTLVVGGTVQATWLPDGRFWYRSTSASGTTVHLVDGARKSRTLERNASSFADHPNSIWTSSVNSTQITTTNHQPAKYLVSTMMISNPSFLNLATPSAAITTGSVCV